MPIKMSAGGNGDRRALLARLAAVVALLASVIIFAARGPWRSLGHPSDFVLVYGPARTWLMGGNPYDQPQIDEAWRAAGGPEALKPSSRTTPGLIYPPSTLVLFAPFAALPWPAAHYAWIIGNVAFLAVVLGCLCRFAGFRPAQARTWLLVAAALLFAPVHTTFHHGQTPLFVMALVLAAFVFKSAAGSGIMVGLAAALKPQIGLPFIALEGVRQRWRSVMIALAVLAGTLAIAIVPMVARGVRWWDSWRANLAAFSAGGAGDPSALNPHRHQMVNLHYPITALIENKSIAQALSLAICAALAALFFLPPRRRMASTPLLHALAMVAALTMMVAYHRFYDAVLLLAPLAWAIDALARRRCVALAAATMTLLIPFFLNSATALAWFAGRDRLPHWLVDGWWWQHMLLPHQGWAILGIAICLLLAQREVARAGPPAPPAVSG